MLVLLVKIGGRYVVDLGLVPCAIEPAVYLFTSVVSQNINTSSHPFRFPPASPNLLNLNTHVFTNPFIQSTSTPSISPAS
jgi:hypothetical protein